MSPRSSAPLGGESSRVGGLSQCAPIFFLRHQKENGRTRSKEKMFRRVGPQVCGPPASGEGWLALPRGSQRRKRAALGAIQAWGSPGYRQRRFYPQGVRRIRKAAEPQTAAQPLPLALPCGKLSGSEKRSRGNATITPTPSAPSATGRQLQKSQKALACPKARQNRSRHRYADPRARGGPPHRSAAKRFFSLDRSAARFSFWRSKKRNGGRNGPATIMAEFPRPMGRVYFSSNTDTYTVPVTSKPSFAFT